MTPLPTKPSELRGWALERLLQAVESVGTGPYLTIADLAKIIRACDAAEAEEGNLAQWQPMATAPRDGRKILIRKESSLYFVAKWDALRARWAKDDALSHEDNKALTGWLPIPGEDGPR